MLHILQYAYFFHMSDSLDIILSDILYTDTLPQWLHFCGLSPSNRMNFWNIYEIGWFIAWLFCYHWCKYQKISTFRPILKIINQNCKNFFNCNFYFCAFIWFLANMYPHMTIEIPLSFLTSVYPHMSIEISL